MSIMFKLTPKRLFTTSNIISTKKPTQNAPILHKFTPQEISQNLSLSLPFSVERKESGFLPVYHQLKNGRTRSVTVVRGIKGNVDEFKRFLGKVIPEDRIEKISQRALKIQGNYVETVREILTLHKF